jgi:hypothetical protein
MEDSANGGLSQGMLPLQGQRRESCLRTHNNARKRLETNDWIWGITTMSRVLVQPS